METEDQDGGAREGLPLSFYARWESSTVDEKLVLAREAASHPGFDEEDAFEVGSRLEESLEEVGRFAEFESVLDVWKQRAPRVHDAEPAVRTWRVELALRLPGGDVKGALVSLARRTGDCALVTRLAEWCLYRGRVEEARAGLLEAWPRVREDESLADWTRVDYVTRAVLTCMDAGLRRAPALSEEELGVLLAPFDRAVPHWVGEALALRTGRESWRRRSGHEVLLLPSERFFDAQRALVMSFEPELRLRQGWPWGRTQLIFPELFHLLPGPHGDGGRDLRPQHVLLPLLGDLEQWVRGQGEERALHPHVHAATALSLRPWGEYLRGLGLLGAEAWTGWWQGAWDVLSALPEQFATAGDPVLVEEVHRFFREGGSI
ncbi:hypothetical protein [Melittangium boletus]|uniref:Uncharacterized protein n=1 Tax=Melittangium boletus DSM 14713 TaxID=1294270 RepID=A0A250IEQ5_9BACT|nr:hypothetical protein [Melittangium boletus]ATB29426.1 hypothetical protein MEBOL_002875 [Melittangium boletus DSM 14713]